MNRTTSGDAKGKAERQQTILRLIQEHPISRQEVLLEHLREEGFAVTQATISRDIRELCLVKAATSDGYRYVSSHNESLNPKMQGRFETIFHESVLGVDYAGHVVLVKCYSAWQMLPVRCLTRSSGRMLSVPFPVMIRSSLWRVPNGMPKPSAMS